MRHSSILCLSVLVACGGGSYGVSPGGLQDMGQAREIIANGGVPTADQFTSEGLFSEHDLPFDGAEACGALLCPRVGTVDVDPVDGSGPQVLAQIGFDTSITEVQRPALSLALVVDVSGSMAGEKMTSVRQALRTLVPELGPQDEVTLVAFDNKSQVRLRLTAMDAAGRQDLLDEIDGLHDAGGTNIEAGLMDGYDELSDASGGKQPWLMLFTDAQPNVGMTGPQGFRALVRDHQDDVGLSVFGVGEDLGSKLFELVAETRNANGRTLYTTHDIQHVFDDLDLMVTPIAHDLELTVETEDGIVQARTFGAPSERHDGVTVGATTLFLSRNGGGIGVLLQSSVPPEAGERIPVMPQSVGTLNLAWTPVDGEREHISLGVLREEVPAHTGPVKMAGLVDEILALEAGAAFCYGSLEQGEADRRITGAEEHLRDLAGSLKDSALLEEAELMAMLAENLRAGGCSY